MKRIWKNYNKWEDFKFGFYSNEKQDLEKEIISFFSCSESFKKTGLLLLDQWPNCMNHNLSYLGSNRRSYLGQAACCFNFGANQKTTSLAWNKLPRDIQDQANAIADELIRIYEEKYYIEPNGVNNEKLS